MSHQDWSKATRLEDSEMLGKLFIWLHRQRLDRKLWYSYRYILGQKNGSRGYLGSEFSGMKFASIHGVYSDSVSMAAMLGGQKFELRGGYSKLHRDDSSHYSYECIGSFERVQLLIDKKLKIDVGFESVNLASDYTIHRAAFEYELGKYSQGHGIELSHIIEFHHDDRSEEIIDAIYKIAAVHFDADALDVPTSDPLSISDKLTLPPDIFPRNLSAYWRRIFKST